MTSAKSHLRCQIKYEKGSENYRKAVVDAVRPITEINGVENYYFFWQEYSKKFERQV